MPVAGLGHVGIYTDDLMKQRDFYTRVIGLSIADEDLDGRGMCFLSADPVSEHHEFVLMKGRVSSDDTNTIQQISFKVPSNFACSGAKGVSNTSADFCRLLTLPRI